MKRVNIISLLYRAALVALTLSVGGCSKETLVDGGTDAQATLSATLARSPGETIPAETKINGVRMIIFRSPKPGLGGGQMVRNTYKAEANPTFHEVVPVGDLDIYLIANELGAQAGADNWNLGSVTSIEALEQKIANYTTHPVVSDSKPIPMCARYRNVRIDRNGSMTHQGATLTLDKVPLERIIAKTTLNLDCVFANLPDGGQALTLESVQVKRMPRFSHLCPGHRYMKGSDGDFIDGPTASLAGVQYQYGDPLNPAKKTGFTGAFNFYLPEYLPNDASKYTYFDIVACADANPSVKFRYKLIIGDVIDNGAGGKKSNTEMAASNLTVDFNLTRNTHYIFNTQIKSYGTIDGMIVDPTVEPWGEPKEVEQDLKGHILNVSDIQASITDLTMARIYFWSNQKDVMVDELGYTGATGTATFTVNSFFDKLAGVGAEATNFHYTYNKTTQSGTGYMDINMTEEKHGSELTDTRRILLNAGGLKREIKVTSIIPTPPIPWSTTPWVGTFHRWNETGERIIYSAHTGAWSATVEYPAGTPEADKFVILNGVPTLKGTISEDPNIKSDNPGEAENYTVLGNSQTVSGGGYRIYFRVGMKSKLASATSAPRYAKIKVTHSGGVSYLYVRQGEAPAAINPAFPNIKWSTYNLTENGGYNKLLPVRGAKFAKYPTQAGAFFQWGSLYAWPPVGDVTWSNQYNAGEWLDTREPCPSSEYSGDGRNYSTPVGGTKSAGENGSLTSICEAGNSIWGYYADGHFDRRTVSMIPGTGSVANTAVSVNTNDVAFVGRIFFDPTNYTSLFVPSTGNRNPDVNGSHNYAGHGGYWWSKSPSSTNGMYAYISIGNAAQSNTRRNFGLSIRCVTAE